MQNKKLTAIISKLAELIQLSIIYIIGFACLTLAVSDASSGAFAKNLGKSGWVVKAIIASPWLKFLGSPERSMILYLIGIDTVLRRRSLSIFVRYNTLLVFILEMMVHLVLFSWELLIQRDAATFGVKSFIPAQKNILFLKYFYLFAVCLYAYCYYKAITNELPKFAGPFQKIPDSISFWFKLYTKEEVQKRNGEK